jgi:cell division septation protein DedD
MYHKAFKTEVRVTCYPDPQSVKDCEEDYTLTYPGHLGLDCVPLDLAKDLLYAMADGTIVEMCNDWKKKQKMPSLSQRINPPTSGNAITIKTDLCEYTMKHMATNPYDIVSFGQTVKEGDYIGIMGDTGETTGAHLHVDVIYDNAFVDPSPYVRGDKALATQEVTVQDPTQSQEIDESVENRYKVQAGAYTIYENAVSAMKIAKSKGFSDAFIYDSGASQNRYKLQLGAFTVLDNARAQKSLVKSSGYSDAFILDSVTGQGIS